MCLRKYSQFHCFRQRHQETHKSKIQEQKPISVDFVIIKTSNQHKPSARKKSDIDKDDVFVLDTKPTEYNVNYNDIIPLSIILWCIQPYFVYLIYFVPFFYYCCWMCHCKSPWHHPFARKHTHTHAQNLTKSTCTAEMTKFTHF